MTTERDLEFLDDIADQNDPHGNTRAKQGRKRGQGTFHPAPYKNTRAVRDRIRMLVTRDAKRRAK